MSIPVEQRFVPCRFGDGHHAVGKYKLPNGCACYPDDREQDICGQHVIKGGMNEDYEVILIYDVSFYEMYLGKERVAKEVYGST